MKAYKGFNKDMTCRGFQYKEGETFHEDEAKLCHKGFHACMNPLDVYNYYDVNNCIIHEVELEDVSDERENDTKVCAKTIKIGAELSVAGICKAHFEYVKSNCKETNSRIAGDNESASAGESGSASAGESGSASAGESGSASAGNWGSASAGNWGSASAGYWGSASAGYKGSASAGESGSASAGKNGIACALNGKVSGKIGCTICTTESDEYGNTINAKCAIVDGVKIKENTWYIVKNNKWVEV